MQNAIADNAYQRELARESGEEIVVGVNKYAETESAPVPIQRIDQAAVADQIGPHVRLQGRRRTPPRWRRR